MAKFPKKHATQADLRNLPENKTGEIVDGQLWVSPRPHPRHAAAQAALLIELGSPFDRGRGGPGGWRILVEPELHLGDDIVVPDLVGWKRARLLTLPEEAFFRLPPDWLCEVLSPRTANFDRRDKLGVYARAGVSHAWLVDPAAKTLEVLKLVGGAWSLLSTHRESDQFRSEPFDAIELDLGLLWA